MSERLLNGSPGLEAHDYLPSGADPPLHPVQVVYLLFKCASCLPLPEPYFILAPAATSSWRDFCSDSAESSYFSGLCMSLASVKL